MKKITREEWLTMSNEQGWNNIQKLQSELEALEGRKDRGGMTEEDAKFLHWVADRMDFVQKIRKIAGPLPPKVTRERTYQELTTELLKKHVIGASVIGIIKHETVLDLCTAAGISTTTEEV